MTPEQRQMMIERLMAAPQDRPPTATIQVDMGVAPAIMQVIEALKALPGMVQIPEPVDNGAALDAIAKAVSKIKPADLSGVASIARAVEVLTAAVSAIKTANVSLRGVEDAIDRLTASQRAIAAALRAERELILDDDGKPTGTRVITVN